MFYSEKLQSPINAYWVKRLYGVNPDNDPERAALIGIYPLTEAPEGYSPTHYVKEGSGYTAVANPVSNLQRQMLAVIESVDLTTLAGLRTALGLPAEAETPQAIDGYYPLYVSEAEANAAGDGTSHTHAFDGETYYMPNGVEFFHGDYAY